MNSSDLESIKKDIDEATKTAYDSVLLNLEKIKSLNKDNYNNIMCRIVNIREFTNNSIDKLTINKIFDNLTELKKVCNNQFECTTALISMVRHCCTIKED